MWYEAKKRKTNSKYEKYVQKRIVVTPIGTRSSIKSNRKEAMDVFKEICTAKVSPTWPKNAMTLLDLRQP